MQCVATVPFKRCWPLLVTSILLKGLFMTAKCPKCDSTHVDTNDLARKAVGAIGFLVGAAVGMSGLMGHAGLGKFVDPVVGEGETFWTVFLECLVGSATGCALGASLGAAIDDSLLDNCCCLSCGHTFSPPRGYPRGTSTDSAFVLKKLNQWADSGTCQELKQKAIDAGKS